MFQYWFRKHPTRQLEKDPEKLIKQKEKQMDGAVKILDFETAAILRDEILELQKILEKKAKADKKAKVKNPRNKDLLM
jgi:excinuclease UvrABC nuclease subunit